MLQFWQRFKDNRWMKYQEDTEDYYSQLYQRKLACSTQKHLQEIAVLTDNHVEETHKLIAKHKQTLEDIKSDFEQELSRVRADERRKLLTIVTERDEEIERLNKKMKEVQEVYDHLRERENSLFELANSIGDKYTRWENMVGKSVQTLKAIDDDLKKYKRQYLKDTEEFETHVKAIQI